MLLDRQPMKVLKEDAVRCTLTLKLFSFGQMLQKYLHYAPYSIVLYGSRSCQQYKLFGDMIFRTYKNKIFNKYILNCHRHVTLVLNLVLVILGDKKHSLIYCFMFVTGFMLQKWSQRLNTCIAKVAMHTALLVCIHEILLEWWWIIACMSMSMDIHLCPLVSTCVNIR